MNTTKQVVAAIAFSALSSVSAFAGTIGDVSTADDSFASTQTRAQVKAGVLAARAAGVTQFADEVSAKIAPNVAPVPSTLTRAQVLDEARASLRSASRQHTPAYNPAA